MVAQAVVAPLQHQTTNGCLRCVVFYICIFSFHSRATAFGELRCIRQNTRACACSCFKFGRCRMLPNDSATDSYQSTRTNFVQCITVRLITSSLTHCLFSCDISSLRRWTFSCFVGGMARYSWKPHVAIGWVRKNTIWILLDLRCRGCCETLKNNKNCFLKSNLGIFCSIKKQFFFFKKKHFF